MIVHVSFVVPPLCGIPPPRFRYCLVFIFTIFVALARYTLPIDRFSHHLESFFPPLTSCPSFVCVWLLTYTPRLVSAVAVACACRKETAGRRSLTLRDYRFTMFRSGSMLLNPLSASNYQKSLESSMTSSRRTENAFNKYLQISLDRFVL